MFRYLTIFLALGVVLLGFNLTFSQDKSETAELLYVVDGDTIRVKLNGQSEYVRLIGVNSPELTDTRELVRCFAEKSKAAAQKKLPKTLTLVADPSQVDRDRYGRLLRYVFIEKENFNLWLIANGWAYEYTYSKPYKYQKEFKTAQSKAEKSETGLWGDACG